MSFVVEGIHIDPPVVLAPMAGITDLPFRRRVARYGAGLLVSEMVLSHAMHLPRGGALARARVESDIPTSVQIAGREAGQMADAARYAEDAGAPIIDINMGCPAKKVTGGLSGAALMRDLDLARRLIDATVAATSRPVTLKMRLGWDEGSLNAPDLASRAEASGVRMISVHGRTRAQFYKGSADWSAIRAVRRATSLPLVANGDVIDVESARAALDLSGADAVMIGRGAQGRPWLPSQIGAALTGRDPAPAPDLAERAEVMRAHYDDALAFYGDDIGARVMRKHLGWYLDAVAEDLPSAAATARLLKARLLREDRPRSVSDAIMREVRQLDGPGASAEAA